MLKSNADGPLSMQQIVGARIDPIEEEYQSIPLGTAARRGHPDMVTYLLKRAQMPRGQPHFVL